jgi:hypothetical protein
VLIGEVTWIRHQDRRWIGNRRNSRSWTEAEYMALCQVSMESVWLVDVLGGLGVSVQGSMVVNADILGSIALTKSPVFHDRSKHIDIQYHYARDLVKEGRIKLEDVPTKDILADLLKIPALL